MRRNHPPTRPLTCRPVCCPGYRAHQVSSMHASSHASSLNPHRSRAGGGFSVPAPFSRDRRPGRRERSRTSPISQEPGWWCHHPLIPTVASSHALQSSCQVIKPEVLALASTSPCPPLVGVFLFQPCSAANWRNHPLARPLLVCLPEAFLSS